MCRMLISKKSKNIIYKYNMAVFRQILFFLNCILRANSNYKLKGLNDLIFFLDSDDCL